MIQDSFVFYDSFRKAVKKKSDDKRLAFYEAIIDYALTGIEPDLDEELESWFIMAKPQLDANTKRKKDGKKGGRPSKKDDNNLPNNYEENYKKTTGFESENQGFQNKKPNVNVNVNVNGGSDYYGLFNRTVNVPVNLPAKYISTDDLTINLTSQNFGVFSANINQITTSNFSFYGFYPATVSFTSMRINYVACGRWK